MAKAQNPTVIPSVLMSVPALAKYEEARQAFEKTKDIFDGENPRALVALLYIAHASDYCRSEEGLSMVRVVDVAEAMEVDRTTAMKLTDHLESEGYITKEPHPSDRRAKSLDLTTDGMERARFFFDEFHED